MSFVYSPKYVFTALCFLFLFPLLGIGQEAYIQSRVKEGIRLDFSMTHLQEDKPADEFREGDIVKFQFKISDTITGKPLTGAFPAAWMDKISKDPSASCGRKIVSYIEGNLLTRPELDLNVYYVITLNDDNTINVVDPLFSFGGSQLLTQIQLPATGYDWVVSEDQTIVYVSMPEVNQVAFVSTSKMENEYNVSIPGQPKEMVLQEDGRYLWVGYDLPGKFEATSGVAVIDTEEHKLVKTILTGSGHHDIVEGKDNQYMYVSNQNSGTVSVIDIQNLEKEKDISLRDAPLSMAYSDIANALYVVNKLSGHVTVIDGKTNHPFIEFSSETGVNKVKITPDGRLGFLINPETNRLHIFDTATNIIVQSADVEDRPDEVSFSDELAYVRHLGSDVIWMIPLDVIGFEGKEVPLIDFTGGQNPPGKSSPKVGATGIVQAPGANAVLVSNYLDKAVYYYSEGMAAPSGQFNTYGRKPKAVEVIDKSIEEVSLGVYETTVQLRTPGEYDVSVFLDVPTFMECFPVTVLRNEEMELKRLQNTLGALSINYVSVSNPPKVGEEVAITLELTDLKTRELVPELKDVRLMTMNSAGRGKSQIKVTESDTKGVYKAHVKFEEEGLHYVYVECQSRGLTYNNPQFLTLFATQ